MRKTVNATLTAVPWLAVLLAVLLCMQFAAPMAAQSTFGSILGTVTDPSGAAVNGAKIEVLNQATGVSRTLLTDEQGSFRAFNLDPGVYTITASMVNFVTLKNTDVILQARENVNSNFQLKVQTAGEQVLVESDQDVVSVLLTESTSRSGEELSSLPLNFRATNAPSPIETAALTPGVNQDPGGNLTFAGQLPTATSFSLDGISIQSVRFGGPSKDLFPSVEGIAEFRVNTAGNSA
jgi:Carboxypeptidase regulatory-like domain